jgi:endonuclease/exonuclease/phosphatase family metal-dependent hydrolase
MRYFFLCLLAVSLSAYAQPIMIDGVFDDWNQVAPAVSDPQGDGRTDGVDFGIVRVRSDKQWVFIEFETGADVLLQEDNDIKLYIDTDASTSTGYAFGNMGCELVWSFGTRKGTYYGTMGQKSIKHADIRINSCPPVTSNRFELALSRSAKISGASLFPGSRIRIKLEDAAPDGDVVPDGQDYIEVELDSASQALPSIQMSRPDPAGVRMVQWNTLQNGLTDSKRTPSFKRLLAALKPDIMCFQECFKTTAGNVLELVNVALPLQAGGKWSAVRIDSGNVIVTRYPILQSLRIMPEYRETAALIAVDSAMGRFILLINVHLRCCSANDDRQIEADAMTAFLRDVKMGAGRMSVPLNTPIIITGDFNLVGYKNQLETLLTGDISDNTTFGPDAPPDWNNRSFVNTIARHIYTPFAYTWYDASSSYASGKLDYVLHSHDGLAIQNAYVFDTSELTAGELDSLSLLSSDTQTAADHLPTVVDMSIGSTSTAEATPLPSGLRLLGSYPAPARNTAMLCCTARCACDAVIQLHDLLGRSIASERPVRLQPGYNEIPLQLPVGHAGGIYATMRAGTQTAAVRIR